MVTRRNCFDIAVRSLLLGTSVVITAVLVSIGIMQLNKAKSLAGEVGSKLTELESRISESDVMEYDGETLTGAQVKGFCGHYLTQGEAPFEVMIDFSEGSIRGDDYDFVQSLRDEDAATYIRPLDTYYCTVERNGNNVITEVRFERLRVR